MHHASAAMVSLLPSCLQVAAGKFEDARETVDALSKLKEGACIEGGGAGEGAGMLPGGRCFPAMRPPGFQGRFTSRTGRSGKRMRGKGGKGRADTQREDS